MSQQINDLTAQIRRLTAERDALQLSVIELSGELKRLTGSSDQQVIDHVSQVFDPEWYLDYYKDVVALGMDPLEHYRWIGQQLGRAPNKKALKKNWHRSLAGFWETLR